MISISYLTRKCVLSHEESIFLGHATLLYRHSILNSANNGQIKKSLVYDGLDVKFYFLFDSGFGYSGNRS